MANAQDLEILRRIKGLVPGAAQRQAPVVITPYSPESIGNYVNGYAFGTPAQPTSGVWPSANLAIAWPFVLNQYVTVRKLFVMVGAAQTGNIDVGIYDESYNRKVSSGSTALGTANAVQEFDVTDTDLTPGRYYLAVALSSGSGTVFRIAPAVGEWAKASGVVQMAAAFPLPNPLVPAAGTSALIPVSGLSLRTLVN